MRRPSNATSPGTISSTGSGSLPLPAVAAGEMMNPRRSIQSQAARKSGPLFALISIAAILTAVSSAAEPTVRWVPAANRVTVEVSGLDEAAFTVSREWTAEKWSALLAVRVNQAGSPAMLGTWKAEGPLLRFTPQYPLTPGVGYRAELDPTRLPGAAPGAGRITSEYTMPTLPRGPGTVLTQIFPSGEEVPENLLKFYLHFSAPMSRGNIYDHIHLRNEEGKDVELPFLEIDEELWNPEMTRLTLFIDPGRIKREVRPLEEIGPSLEEGKRFTLAIDAAWIDATGQPLKEKHERTFRVGPADRTAIAPSDWKIAAPSAGRFGALRVTFPKPMDHALAMRLLQVTREDSTPIAGKTTLTEAERVWSFTPSRPWQAGAYRLVVPATLEDLAGNNVGKAFEVELLERGARREVGATERLPFTVK